MLNLFLDITDKQTRPSRIFHKRYYTIAGITIKIESDVLISPNSFHQKFTQFEASSPTDDVITIRHHSWLPAINMQALGKRVYNAPPWQIYQHGDKWVYVRVIPKDKKQEVQSLSLFTHDYGFGEIYHSDQSSFFTPTGSSSLSFLPTDQIILAQALAYRSGCYMHACGIDWHGKGILFLGRSGAGKSTVARMFQGEAHVLCDDRIIVRNQDGTFRIYGTWSHGDVKEITNRGVPLHSIYVLSKDTLSRVEAMRQKREVLKNLFSRLIRPYVTVSWFKKIAETISAVTDKVPCYRIFFNRSGDMVQLLNQKVHGERHLRVRE
jgi:hypothetical protein